MDPSIIGVWCTVDRARLYHPLDFHGFGRQIAILVIFGPVDSLWPTYGEPYRNGTQVQAKHFLSVRFITFYQPDTVS